MNPETVLKLHRWHSQQDAEAHKNPNSIARLHHLDKDGTLYIQQGNDSPQQAMTLVQLPEEAWQPNQLLLITQIDGFDIPVVLGPIFQNAVAETPKTLRIDAQEQVDIGVGDNRLVISHNRAVLRAESIVSRALKIHKIRGSSVRIN